jgi:hypothetical protein
MNKYRIKREEETLVVMIRMYCKKNHSPINLCDECDELEAYALSKLRKCTYGNKKPVCSKCKTHCYNPVMREKIKRVMRYSGPRMILYHPVMAVMHTYDKVK